MSKNKKPKAESETSELQAEPVNVAASAETFDVAKLSHKTGNRIKINGHNPNNIKGVSPEHRCADTLHGWSEYAHHYAKPMMLTESDYLAAIKAAGNYEKHEPAISPHRK